MAESSVFIILSEKPKKKYKRKPTWHDHLVAGLTAVAVLSCATLATHYLAVVAGTERFRGQRLVALGTAETVFVPVAVLMVQLLNTGKGLGERRCPH